MPCITWPIQGRYADASVDQHCAYPCQLRSRSRTPMVHLHAHRIISDDSCHLTLAFQLLQKRNANLSCAMVADHLIALHSYRISERTGRMFLESDTCFLLFQRFYRISDPGCLHQKYGALSTPYAVAISVVGYAITAGIFCSRIETSSLASELELSWGFCTTNVAMLTYGVFSMIMNLSAEGNGKWGSCIRDISIHSYGIYLAHIMVLNILYRYLNPLFDTVLLSVPVISAATFICVYAVVKLLSKAPYSKYWLG